MISKRARRWSEHEQDLVFAHFNCANDEFEPVKNPGGYVNFGTAENKLLFKDILPLLEKCSKFQESDTHYNELYGSSCLRNALAPVLSRRAGRALSSDNIVIASGASAILEILAFALCDPYDRIMIPAPYYTGFDHDLALRSEAKLLPICLNSPGFKLTAESMKSQYEKAMKEGLNVRAVLLNSPHNPLGYVYGEELVRELAGFFEAESVHVICDEVYTESLLPGIRHFSGLKLQSPFVHVVYSFAKDFGLSGYKVGTLHTENPEVLEAAKALAYFHTVSGQTQRLLSGVLESPELGRFFETTRKRVLDSYRYAASVFSKTGINYVEPEGGIFLWLDLRPFLTESSFDGEMNLFKRIFNECKVNVSPGQAFHCHEPGWFRLCYAVPHLDEGLKRLIAYFSEKIS